MRTLKALACAAALAAGLATAVAQNVYSLNVVGYYNVTVDPGKQFMIANQLNTTNNQIQYILSTVPDGTQLFKYINGAYQTATFVGFLGGWDQPTWTLNLGETAMVKDNAGSGQTITFVGEVAQGILTVTQGLPAGVKVFVSSMVPQEGTPAAFNVPAEDGDQIFVYNNGYATDTYVGFLGGWGQGGGAGPTVKVGQGFAYKKAAAGVSTIWVRNFTVL